MSTERPSAPLSMATVLWIGAACFVGIVVLLIVAGMDWDLWPLICLLGGIFVLPRLVASMWTRGRSEDWRRRR